MSGGAFDYLEFVVDSIFIHDIEWAESGDINMSDVVEKWRDRK